MLAFLFLDRYILYKYIVAYCPYFVDFLDLDSLNERRAFVPADTINYDLIY